MQIYIALVLSVIAVVTAVLQHWPKTSTNQEQPFVFPLLTMIAIDLVALLAPSPVNLLYKGALLFGLLVSTLAVLFLYIPKTPIYIAAAHFLIVYFVYFVGISSANRIAIPSPIFLLVIAYGGLVYWYAHDKLKEQRGALIAYIVMAAFMVWAASEAWVQHQELWSTFIFAGALLLAISNTMWLVNNTRTPIKWLNTIVSGSMFGGQLLVAWSIWGVV